MNKHVTRLLIREGRRGHARLLAKHIRDLINAAEIITKWRSTAQSRIHGNIFLLDILR